MHKARRHGSLLGVWVSSDPSDEVANRHRCPIANSILLGDLDTSHVSVDREFIRFSRRSTNKRYVFHTPVTAKTFLDGLDRLIGKKTIADEDLPPGFWLYLYESDLISASARKVGKSNQRRQTTKPPMTRKIATVLPQPKVKPQTDRGSRSRRFVTS